MSIMTERTTSKTLPHLQDGEHPDFIIYHHPCSDGFGSAFAVWMYMKEFHPDAEITYYPTNHGSQPPDVSGKNVLICDFSYKKDPLTMMIKQAKSLLVIDHHKSAQEGLADIDTKNKIFDMKSSGASLTWSYLFPDRAIPLIIKYIEDRDIWTKKLENTDAFASWFYTRPFDFEEYIKYLDDKLLLKMIEEKGLSFIELNEHYTETAMKSVAPKFVQIGSKYYFVGFLNTSILKSDIGNRIFTDYPNVDFAAVYSISDRYNSTGFSLRSTNKHTDVSEIAVQFGGGGHRNASGIGFNHVCNSIGTVLDTGRLYEQINGIYFDCMNIGSNRFNVVYLNLNSSKSAVGSYLLQTKYTDGDQSIQECVAICHNTREDDIGNPTVHISAVWHYNGKTGLTEYCITLHPTIERYRDDINYWFKTNVNQQVNYKGVIPVINETLVPVSLE